MATIRCLLEVYHKNSETKKYSTTPDHSMTNIDLYDHDASIETSADSFTISFRNIKTPSGVYVYKDYFKVDDRVILYITGQVDITNTNKTSYRRFDGIVGEVEEEMSVDGRRIVIRGLNRLDKILNLTWPGAFTNLPASTMIQNLIDHVNESQRRESDGIRSNQIVWDSGNDVTTEKINYWRSYKPVFEMIEELSQLKFNLEGEFYYYLTTDNRFIWKKKGYDTRGLEIEEGVDFTSIKIREKIWEVINAMIANCGKDALGRAVLAMAYNEASIAEFGLKWHPGIEVQQEIGIMIMSRQRGQPGWGAGNTTSFPAAYPFTMSFVERDANGRITSTTNKVVNSNQEFNAALRHEMQSAGTDWIKTVLDMTGVVRPKVDVTMRGYWWETGVLNSSNNPLNQGDWVKIICPTHGWSGTNTKEYRLVSLSHIINMSGWFVDLALSSEVEEEKYTGHGG